MKTYVYRFMLSGIEGTLQEGIFQATGTGHAQRLAERICRNDVLPNEVIGKWSRWEARGRVYGCSFLKSHLNRQTHRLLITEIATHGIPSDTAGDDHSPTAIHRLLPAW